MADRLAPPDFFRLNEAKSTPQIEREINAFYGTISAPCEPDAAPDLYHYTTLAGLRGILESRQLWFSHVSSLNDPSEIQHGQKIVSDVIDDALLEYNEADLRNFLRKLNSYAQAFESPAFDVFIACFCEKRNLLSQWRAYADQGGRYCLGFEFSDSTRLMSDPVNPAESEMPLLRKIVYEEEEQWRLVRGYVNRIVEAAKDALNDSANAPSEMAAQAANGLLDLILMFKHKAFRREEEWRIVRVMREVQSRHCLNFRENEGILTPYWPTYLCDPDQNGFRFPLRKIGFGPTLESRQAKASVELLIRHEETPDSKVKLLPELIKVNGPDYRLRPS